MSDNSVSADLIQARTESSREGMGAFQTRFFTFLSAHTARYTLNDSSSIPKELAEDLMRAACYVMDIGINGECLQVTDEDLEARYNRGIKAIEKKMALSKRLWRVACKSMPEIENESMVSTLESIGTFWKHYNYRFFADQIPCDIDYQLCLPVPDAFLGVDYLIEWLTRFIIESQLVQCFETERCIQVLEGHCPDYKGLLINLYDPIAANALGKVLSGGDVTELVMAAWEWQQIIQLFSGRTEAAQIQLLEQSADRLCECLNINSVRSQEYLKAHAVSLAPRIRSVSGTLTAETMDAIIEKS